MIIIMLYGCDCDAQVEAVEHNGREHYHCSECGCECYIHEEER